LEHDWEGWWSKLELFKPGLFYGPVLYLDLDTIVTGSLDEFCSNIEGFGMLQDLGDVKRKGPYALDEYSGSVSRMASGVMAWNGDYSNIYLEYAEKPKFRGGDQRYIQHQVKEPIKVIQRGLNVASYKWECLDGVPENTNIVCFHGNPRPRDINWELQWNQ